MTRYEGIMQEMTPRKFATILDTGKLKCYYCIHKGKETCREHYGNSSFCIDGITNWLEKKLPINKKGNR